MLRDYAADDRAQLIRIACDKCADPRETIKRQDAIRYLSARDLWRGAARCRHRYIDSDGRRTWECERL